MKTLKILLIAFIAILFYTNIQAQTSRSAKQEQIIIPGKQKIHKTDFDSIWKFTNFNTKSKYFVDFDYNAFLDMPKKVKYWGAMEPLINYMEANPRQTVNFVAIYAINPSIEDPTRRKQLNNEAPPIAKKALESLFSYLKENNFNNKVSMQIAEIDYRYWLGDNFFDTPEIKNEIIHVGLLISLSTKKNVFFPAPPTEVKTFKNIKFFPNNSDLIESYQSVIKEVADYLKSDDKLEVVLTGYSDNTGTESYNINLSKRRADAIKSELIKLNIEPYRIEVIGMGSANPIGDNNTHEGKVANNRVEISIR